MYRIPHYKDTRIYFQEGGDPIIKDHDTIYTYYLRKGRSSDIYKLDSLSDPVFKSKPVDSLYKSSSIYKEPSFYENEIMPSVRKLNSVTKGNVTIESFIRNVERKEKNITVADTFYLYYNSNSFWKNVPYSFNFNSDSSKKGKLIKVKLVWNQLENAEELFMRKAKIYATEIREIKLDNKNEVAAVFKRFEDFLGK